MMLRSLISLATIAFAASIANAATFTFPVHLTGAQEAPGPGDADGFADGTVTFDNVANTVSWSFTYANIAAPTAMHIHSAQDGIAGAVLVNFGVVTTGGPGTLVNTTPTTAANITNILANPQNFYVNVHNAPFAAGAIRGQIPKIYNVTLIGGQEVPGPGDDNGSAVGQLMLDTGNNRVQWNFTYTDIDAPMDFHIHDGDVGVAGPVFIGLGVATTGGRGTLISETPATDVQLDAIIAEPTGFYLNIHTRPFPAGAVRGQIVLPPNPSDLNGDGVVNAADLALLLGAWGTAGPGDLNGDGIVDAADLAILLGAWS